MWNHKIFRCILYFSAKYAKNALFSWKIYTAGKNFTRLPVATVVTSLIMCAMPGKVSWRGSSWTLHVALYKLLHSSSRVRIWLSTTILKWHSTSSLDSFTLSRFRRSAFNVPEFPVNGRTAECAWILCFLWNISHPFLWDLGAGIYILIINFKKGICVKQRQSRQFNSILLISAVLFGLQWKPVFLNIVYSYIASTFGSTDPLSGNVNLVGNVHCPSCKVEKRTSVHETETEVSKFKNSKFQNIFWLITSTTKYIQNLGELSALGESGRKVKQGRTNLTFVRGTFQLAVMMTTKMMMMMMTTMIIIDHRDNGDDDGEQLSSPRWWKIPLPSQRPDFTFATAHWCKSRFEAYHITISQWQIHKSVIKHIHRPLFKGLLENYVITLGGSLSFTIIKRIDEHYSDDQWS